MDVVVQSDESSQQLCLLPGKRIDAVRAAVRRLWKQRFEPLTVGADVSAGAQSPFNVSQQWKTLCARQESLVREQSPRTQGYLDDVVRWLAISERTRSMKLWNWIEQVIAETLPRISPTDLQQLSVGDVLNSCFIQNERNTLGDG
jgi:hypothetical protein